MKTTSWSSWHHRENLSSKEYICGYCSCKIGSTHGFRTTDLVDGHLHYIYICTNCGLPTLFWNTECSPGPILGRDIKSLPTDVAVIYKEIRDSIKTCTYTSALLLARKLLMHLAVDKAGAKEGESFAAYIEHLKSSGYIPPSGDQILKFIKDLGNEKNHEIKIGSQVEAEKTLKFIEGLLIFIYEFPSEMQTNSAVPNQ